MDDGARLALDRESVVVWPCLREERIGGWTLRFANGLYGRSNSVQPHGDPGFPLDVAVAYCEAAYRKENLPPIFRVPDVARCAELDAFLADRGYSREVPTLVQLAPLVRPATHDSPGVRLSADLDADWLDAYCEINGRAPGREPTVAAIFARVPAPRRFAIISADGQPVSIGMASTFSGTVWIFGMATRASHRDRGFGTRILGAMLSWGQSEGAFRAALQVQESSKAALALYRKFGFTTEYRYHYRRAPTG